MPCGSVPLVLGYGAAAIKDRRRGDAKSKMHNPA
jgi:hypothetical protein